MYAAFSIMRFQTDTKEQSFQTERILNRCIFVLLKLAELEVEGQQETTHGLMCCFKSR